MVKPHGTKHLIPMTKRVFRRCVLGSQAGFQLCLLTVVPNVACSSGLNGSKDSGAGIRSLGFLEDHPISALTVTNVTVKGKLRAS